jgi:hypothetical protein
MALICLFHSAQAQRYIWLADSLMKADPGYAMDRYHGILRFHDPIMYLAYPVIRPVVERKLPLEDGEGKDGYWLEGNLAYRFMIYQAKHHSYRFFQRMRPTLDIDFMMRLTKDHSSPLLPSNNKVGLGLDYLFSSLGQLHQERANLLWATFQLHHYSNGQADSFFIENPIKRNNYTGGDFSTNYYRIIMNMVSSSQTGAMVSGAVGFQKEIDLGGPLSSSRELERYYGRERLLFNFQWAPKPKKRMVQYPDHSTAAADTVSQEKRRQLCFRTQVEYIWKGVSRFEGENKRRIGWHTYLTLMPSVTNEVGFMLHTYLGRDYLNIRFDDVVFVGELGVNIRFNGR